MSSELKVPNLPESVADALIAAWHKHPGESFKEGELLVDLETDKIMLEVPAPFDGKLISISAKLNQQVKSSELLAIIEEGAVDTPSNIEKSSPAEAPSIKKEDASQSMAKVDDESHSCDEGQVGPAMRRKLYETGEEQSIINSRREERVPMSRLRQTIARRLLQAQEQSAILTTFNEVNMKPIMDLRAKYKADFEKIHDSRLGFMSFFVKACCYALQKYPEVNASIDGNDVIYHNYQDIGIAVSSSKGLVVPILRNAENMSMSEIETNIRQFGAKAKAGKLTLEELTGGTFSISNGGVFGSMMSTPILNPPQSAILGMHNIVKRAVVENDEIVIRPMMYLALSYDHRMIDGSQSVSFLVTIKQILEDPSRMLLDI